MAQAGRRPTKEALEDVQWLDGDERSTWLALAAVMVKLPAALDAQLQRDAGLSFFEYMVLAMPSERPARTMRMSELAALTHASPSRLSHGESVGSRGTCVVSPVRTTVAPQMQFSPMPAWTRWSPRLPATWRPCGRTSSMR